MHSLTILKRRPKPKSSKINSVSLHYQINKDMYKGIIYMYTSPSGKMYIGQTINEKSRKNQHRSRTSKLQTYFGRALSKYGYDNFTYKVLIRFKSVEDKIKLNRVLNKLEMRYIKLYQTNNSEFGYNLTLGGDGALGYVFTPEQKQASLESSIKRGVTKTVYQFSKDKIFIQSFPSINQAAESLKGNTPLISKRISEVCNNKWESAYNYI